MVIAALGAEPIKDPSVGDWEGGSLACALCGLWAHLGVGGGAAKAKWQGLISFAKMLPLNVDVQL